MGYRLFRRPPSYMGIMGTRAYPISKYSKYSKYSMHTTKVWIDRIRLPLPP